MPKLSHLFTDFPNPITDTFAKLHKYKSVDLFTNTSPQTTTIADDVANKMKIKEQKLVANTTDIIKRRTNRKKSSRKKKGTRRKTIRKTIRN